jgi:hypothetical protein
LEALVAAVPYREQFRPKARFQHLDRFNWIVIGGASKTSRMPKWAPPFTWIDDLVRQPRVARVKVYFKSNLFDGNARILEMPFYAPIEPDPAAAPAILLT